MTIHCSLIFHIFFIFIVKRNKRGDDKLYVGPGNKGFSELTSLYKKKTDKSVETTILIDGVQGFVLISQENVEQGG